MSSCRWEPSFITKVRIHHWCQFIKNNEKYQNRPNTGCIKKTEQIWNCSQFRKTAISIQFLMPIVSLGTYNVEIWKKFLELKICEPGGCVFSNKLKIACARNLKALIIFWVNRWKMCWAFNYCTKFQTICFSLSPLTIHANLHFFLKNQLFACLIMPLPNLHMSAICKLGKGIN
jgi:hypothetical protein